MRRAPTKPGFQAVTAASLVPAPPCVNPRKGGAYCGACAACKTRVCGPAWWLMDRGAVERAMLAAAVDEDACRRRVDDARETFGRVVGPITGELAAKNGVAR